MQLTCPKCHGVMRQYERSGVLVDQCTECRGIFLDRGELERLIDAEAAFHSAAPPRGYDRRYDDDDYRRPYGYGHKPYKRKSFLAELFD